MLLFNLDSSSPLGRVTYFDQCVNESFFPNHKLSQVALHDYGVLSQSHRESGNH